MIVALYQMSDALPGSSRDVPVYINISNKTATIDLIKRAQLVIWRSLKSRGSLGPM